MKTFNQLDEKDAPNIHRMLSNEEKELRSILLEKIIKTPGAVHLSDMIIQEKNCEINILTALKSLVSKGLAAMRDDGGVTGVYPFSALPTNHQVRLENGSSVFAMCAIDSLGIAYELKQNVTVTSSCSHCRGHIAIEIINGEVSKAEPGSALALHVTLGDYKDWASTCWNNMNFFCTERHLDDWIKDSQVNQAIFYSLNIKEAAVVGKLIFGQ